MLQILFYLMIKISKYYSEKKAILRNNNNFSQLSRKSLKNIWELKQQAME